VKNTIIQNNIVISRTRLQKNWFPESFNMFASQHLDEFITWRPELIILGTGKSHTMPKENLTAYVNQKNIGFEIMDTGAACRSYNVLIDEGRDVVACLFLSAN
ncbi:MAG: MTH938/NDUFAF3 family protein, partial [Pseudomonadota bacterium]